jgi:hypothetical protein
MKPSCLLIACFLFFTSNCLAQHGATISKQDLQLFIGDWKGSLTYLDYTSGKPYTMPADLTIKEIKKGRLYLFENKYPNEPNANSSDTVYISADSAQIDLEYIKINVKLENGNTAIVTEVPGVDGNDNKEALIRHIYTIGKNTLVIRKDVKFFNEGQWINRHEYNYSR